MTEGLRMSKSEIGQESRRKRRMTSRITTEPAQPAKLLLMQYPGLPYNPDYVPTNIRCFPAFPSVG